MRDKYFLVMRDRVFINRSHMVILSSEQIEKIGRDHSLFKLE